MTRKPYYGDPTEGPWQYDRNQNAIVSETAFHEQWDEDTPPEPKKIISTYAAMGGDNATADALVLAAAWSMRKALEQARTAIAIISKPDGQLLKQIDEALHRAEYGGAPGPRLTWDIEKGFGIGD